MVLQKSVEEAARRELGLEIHQQFNGALAVESSSLLMRCVVGGLGDGVEQFDELLQPRREECSLSTDLRLLVRV